jgi:hypothetical protein
MLRKEKAACCLSLRTAGRRFGQFVCKNAEVRAEVKRTEVAGVWVEFFGSGHGYTLDSMSEVVHSVKSHRRESLERSRLLLPNPGVTILPMGGSSLAFVDDFKRIAVRVKYIGGVVSRIVFHSYPR